MCLQFLTLYWKMMWMRSWHQVTRKWARLFAMKEFYLKGNCMEMHSQIYTTQTFMDSIILCFGVDSVDRYYHARHNRCVLAISTSGNLSTCYAGRNSLASSGSGIVGRIGRNFFDSTSSKLQAIWKHRYGNCSGLGKGSDGIVPEIFAYEVDWVICNWLEKNDEIRQILNDVLVRVVAM